MLDISYALEVGVRLIVYVDDIVVYVADPDEARAYKKLQDFLTNVQLWCCAHELTLNAVRLTFLSVVTLVFLSDLVGWRSPGATL